MKMPKSLPLLAALAAVLAATPACHKTPEGDPQDKLPITGRSSDPPVALAARWKPGNRYLLFAQATQTSEAGFRQRSISIESSILMDYAVTVSGATNTGRQLDFEIQTLAVSTFVGENQVLFFDSQNQVTPSKGDGVDALAGLIGGHLTVVLKPDGSILRVDGTRELIDKVLSGGDDASNARRGGAASGVAQRIFNPVSLRQFAEWLGLPDRPVRVGDTWVQQRDLFASLAGQLVLNTTNTFAGWQDRNQHACARLDLTGSLTGRVFTNRTGQVLGNLSVKDGRVNGRMWLDPKLEFPVEVVTEVSASILGTRPGPPAGTNAPAGAGTPFSRPLRQTLVVKLKDVQPVGPAN